MDEMLYWVVLTLPMLDLLIHFVFLFLWQDAVPPASAGSLQSACLVLSLHLVLPSLQAPEL